MMDKQAFSSIQATTNTSRYAAAVFRKGNLLCGEKSQASPDTAIILLLMLCAGFARMNILKAICALFANDLCNIPILLK